ncbi:MAG: hypothetical protein WEB56_00685 [Roseovarius sp.]
MPTPFHSPSTAPRGSAPERAAPLHPRNTRSAAMMSAGDGRHHIDPPAQPNIVFAGVLLSGPVALIAFIALLIAGWPLLATMLTAFGLQIAVFCAFLVMGLVPARSSDVPAPPATDFIDAAPARVDIWRTYPSHGAAENAAKVALIAPDLSQSRTIANNLSELGLEVHHCTDRDAVFGSIEARPGDWDLLVFDMDAAPDLGTGQDDLTDFRASCPDMPVLVLSRTAQRNACAKTKTPCMTGLATLRKPVLRAHLVEGLKAANLNLTVTH